MSLKKIIFSFLFVSLSACGLMLDNPKVGEGFDSNIWADRADPKNPRAKIDRNNFYKYIGQYDGGELYAKNPNYVKDKDDFNGGLLVKNEKIVVVYSKSQLDAILSELRNPVNQKITKKTNQKTNLSNASNPSNFGIKGYDLGSSVNLNDKCKNEYLNGIVAQMCSGRTTIFETPFNVETIYSEDKLVQAKFILDLSNELKSSTENPFPQLTTIDYSSLLNNLILRIREDFGEPKKTQTTQSMYGDISSKIDKIDTLSQCNTNNPFATIMCANSKNAGKKFMISRLREQCGNCNVFGNTFTWKRGDLEIVILSVMPERKTAPGLLYNLQLVYLNRSQSNALKTNAQSQIQKESTIKQQREIEKRNREKDVEVQNAKRKMSDF